MLTEIEVVMEKLRELEQKVIAIEKSVDADIREKVAELDGMVRKLNEMLLEE